MNYGVGKITCCRECNERYPGCHDKCPKYLAQKQNMDEQREKVCKAKEQDEPYDQYKFDSIEKARKKRSKNR